MDFFYVFHMSPVYHSILISEACNGFLFRLKQLLIPLRGKLYPLIQGMFPENVKVATR